MIFSHLLEILPFHSTSKKVGKVYFDFIIYINILIFQLKFLQIVAGRRFFTRCLNPCISYFKINFCSIFNNIR